VNAAINGDHRTPEAKAWDVFRKPKKVPDFLGFLSDMTVVEIRPGSQGVTMLNQKPLP
jgi:predicted methyltransferase